MKDIYCVYMTYYGGNKLPPFYIGSSSVRKIHQGYRGSVTSKKWKHIFLSEIKEKPHLFTSEILATFKDRRAALEYELELQKSNNVVKSNWFFNESFATVEGFFGMSAKGAAHWGFGKERTDECKAKISKNHADVCGSNNPRARLIILISPDNTQYKSYGNFTHTCKSLGLSSHTMWAILYGKNPNRGKCVGWKVIRK